LAKFRKRPVEVNAIQWTGKNLDEITEFLEEKAIKNSVSSGYNFYLDYQKVDGGLVIKTLEGEHIASIGDWIIKGVNGEYYPCKPDVFRDTYEAI